jgi:hypothetical protein
MPAVSMAALRRSLRRDLDADFGDIVYFSDVMAPRHEFLTANNQTPYVFAVFDLRRGPMVLDVPAASDEVALFGSGIDAWEVPLADVGPTGEDAGRGGRYAFLPPGFDGQMADGSSRCPPRPTSSISRCGRSRSERARSRTRSPTAGGCGPTASPTRPTRRRAGTSARSPAPG